MASRTSTFLTGAALLLLGALILGCAKSRDRPSPPKSPAVQAFLKRASAAMRASEFRRALALADSAARRADQPGESADVAMLRGRIHSEMGRFSRADSAYDRALEIDPAYRGVWLNKGNNAYRRSSYREAIRYYRRELDRHPGPAPWRGIGRAYVELGVADSAEIAFERAIGVDSSYAPAYHSLALLYEDEGRFEEALEHARAALERSPDNIGFVYQVGLLELRNGKEKQALRHLVRVMEEQPWHQGAHYNIGQALIRLGRTEKAKEFLGRAEELRKLEAQIQQLQNTVRSQPNDPYAHAALGSALRRAGRNNDAMHAYKVASYLAPENTDIRNNVANLYLVRHDTSEAIREYRSILALDSSLVDVWTNLGVVYALSGRDERARRAWREALERDPDHSRARTYLDRLESTGEAAVSRGGVRTPTAPSAESP